MKNKQKQPCLHCLPALTVGSHLPFQLPGVQPPGEPPWVGLGQSGPASVPLCLGVLGPCLGARGPKQGGGGAGAGGSVRCCV